MKLCSRLLMLFVEIYAINAKFRYLNPILGKLGVTHGLGWWHIGKLICDLLLASVEHFRYLLWLRNVYSSDVFVGDRSFDTQILPAQGRPPPTILTNRKLETLGYPIPKTTSFCIPSFWHNTGVWRTDKQTDRQTDGFALAYTAPAKLWFAELCKKATTACKIFNILYSLPLFYSCRMPPCVYSVGPNVRVQNDNSKCIARGAILSTENTIWPFRRQAAALLALPAPSQLFSSLLDTLWRRWF